MIGVSAKKKPDLLSISILDPETRDKETAKSEWPKESEKVEREKVASVGAAWGGDPGAVVQWRTGTR